MYILFTINSKCITSLIPRSCFIRHSKRMPMNIYGIYNLDNDACPLSFNDRNIETRWVAALHAAIEFRWSDLSDRLTNTENKRKIGCGGWPTGGAKTKRPFLEHRLCDGL